jgi:hypothetical protein
MQAPARTPKAAWRTLLAIAACAALAATVPACQAAAPAPAGGGLQAAVPGVSPLTGRIETGSRAVQALLGEIANGATVSLIDTDTGTTISSSLSTPEGRFNLVFGAGFVPVARKPYYLEAVKGLGVGGESNRAGAAAARLRTLAVFDGAWRSFSAGGITIGRASTAGAILAAYLGLGVDQQLLLLERMSGTAFDAAGTAIAAQDYDRVLALVSEALAADQDPVEAVRYRAGAATAEERFFRAPLAAALLASVVPARPARGATASVRAHNLPGPDGATPAIRIGDTAVATWSLDATRAILHLTIPAQATCGYLRVSAGATTWLGPLIPVAGTVCTLAGAGVPGGMDGVGRLARFEYPSGIAVDPEGNVYVSEWDGNRIRKIAYNGVVTTVCGDGSPGRLDATGLGAQFNRPRSLALDAAGNLYAADWNTYRVRRIAPDGVVSTLTRRADFMQNPEDVAGGAIFETEVPPSGIAVDTAGNLYVSEYTDGQWGAGGKGNVIWKVTPGVGISRFAGDNGFYPNVHDGTGTAIRLSAPDGMSFGPDGNLYSMSNGWNHLKRITPQGVSSSLQSDGTFGQNLAGAFPGTLFTNLGWWVAVDASGNVHFPSNGVIRRAGAGGGIAVLAGVAGAVGNADGDLASARFGGHLPQGVFGASGVLYVTDGVNHTVRAVVP